MCTKDIFYNKHKKKFVEPQLSLIKNCYLYTKLSVDSFSTPIYTYIVERHHPTRPEAFMWNDSLALPRVVYVTLSITHARKRVYYIITVSEPFGNAWMHRSLWCLYTDEKYRASLRRRKIAYWAKGSPRDNIIIIYTVVVVCHHRNVRSFQRFRYIIFLMISYKILYYIHEDYIYIACPWNNGVRLLDRR